jgi:FixJ family two-component response regulator
MGAIAKKNLIAVVDDDELVRGALRRLLRASGLGAVSFGSAEDLLKSGQLPDIACLIVDIRMPGMSGLELQAKLKAERCRVPIIFITAHGDTKMRVQAMRNGAVEFLTKPFDNTVLLETVHAAVEDYAKAVGLWGANR